MLFDRILSFLLACTCMLSFRFTAYTPPEDAQIHLPSYEAVEPDASKSCGVQSCVRDHHGVPTLFVNGEPYPSAAYMTYLENYNRYGQFTDAGYTFFSVPTLFAGRWISSSSGLTTPFSKGIFDDRDAPDFSVFDASVRKILDACPDAMIVPRVNVAMPLWWIGAHPDCLDGTGVRESLYSDVWREDAAQMLRAFLRHVLQSDYGAHIAGYQLAGGNTEEWFHFDMNAGWCPAAEAGFAAFLRAYYPDVPFTGLPDLSLLDGKSGYHRSELLARFLEYASWRVADSIAYLAHTAKLETGGNVAIGTFYGYSLEVTSPLYGTHALGLLLESDDIDFISSPNSYIGVRDPDVDWTEMYAADSVRLHGKLCMQECDVRTHLTKPLCECAPEYDPQGIMTAPIWQGLPDKASSVAQMRKSFCRQLVKGNGFWWFDMWGGWYDDPDLMREMQTYRRIYTQSLAGEDRGSAAEIAVFADESAYKWMTGGGQRNAAFDQRKPLGFLGAPYDMYDVRDFDAVYGRYKAVILLQGVKTSAMQNAVRKCRAEKVPFLLSTGQRPTFTVRQLRAFCRANGVHLYCETDDVVYVNARYIAIHATDGGEKTLSLSSGERLTALLGDPQITMQDGRATFRMRSGETILLERQRNAP